MKRLFVFLVYAQFILEGLQATTLPFDNPEKFNFNFRSKNNLFAHLENSEYHPLNLDSKIQRHINAYFHDSQSITITELNGGTSPSKNYKIAHGAREYVLRILEPAASRKEKEQEIQAAIYAGKLGIAPTVHYVSLDFDAIIMDYVIGPTLSLSSLAQGKNLSSFLNTIRKLHESTMGFPQGKNVLQFIKQKLQDQLSESAQPISSNRINNALEKLLFIEDQFKSQPLVPCHNDLNSLNIMQDETGWKLIDWTDAGMSYAYIDLGYFALTNRIREKQHREFLFVYLGRDPTSQELDLLKWGKEVALLKVFTSIFFEREPLIEDDEQRIRREAEIEEMLENTSSRDLDSFFDLHSRGMVTDELILTISLCSLQTFLNSECP